MTKNVIRLRARSAAPAAAIAVSGGWCRKDNATVVAKTDE
jgi:hypothetical protein